jgi:dolichol-phosphate mannosyltransferase
MNNEVSIIIPTYNEKENIPVLIHRIEALGIDAEIIVVDDNSYDGTQESLKRLSGKYKNIRVIERPSKMGISSAVKDALKIASGKYALVMDADLQHPPELIPRLLKEIRKGRDIVVASRYMKGGKSEFGLHRKLISKVATLFAHMSLQETEKISDPLSGFFIFKRDLINPDDIQSKSYKVLLEVVVASKSMNISEISYRFNKRKYGKSKMGPGEFTKFIALVLRLSRYSIVKFLLVGLTGSFIQLGILDILYGNLHLVEYLVLPIAIESSIVSNFIFNNFWTYKMRLTSIKASKKFLSYNLSSMFAFIINFSVATVLTLTILSSNFLLADMAAIVASFSINFLGSNTFVWHV